MVQKLTSYIRDSVAEIKKVTWPTRQQTINYSITVVAMSIGVAIFFGVLDYVFNLGLEKIIK